VNLFTDIFENSYMPKSTKAINHPLRGINHIDDSDSENLIPRDWTRENGLFKFLKFFSRDFQSGFSVDFEERSDDPIQNFPPLFLERFLVKI